MAHNTINIWGKPQLKTPLSVLYISENQDEITMLVLSRTIPTLSKINLPYHKQAQAKSMPLLCSPSSLFPCTLGQRIRMNTICSAQP